MAFLTKRRTYSVAEESMLNFKWPVAIRRSSRRRTMELRVTRDSTIHVLCPASVTDQQIEQWIRSKSSWIDSKLLVNSRRQSIVLPKLQTGASWLYRGQDLTLKIEQSEHSGVELKEDALMVTTTGAGREKILELLRSWYLDQARGRFFQRTALFADRLSVKPARIQLKPFRSMWGRCNCRGEVAYDWRIIIAPDRVLDYLVIHELCHLKHFDHSRSFWSLLESQQPEYRDSRDWLTQQAAFVKSMFLDRFE
jgi:predicted metal-dependent hydrolase